MSRPFKCRRVCSLPGVTYFKPAGIPLKMLEENRLSVEEMEAIRLRDIEHLEQEQCAAQMNISRPTFQRVLASARQKMADALLNGKAIRIEGGNYELASVRFGCARGHMWEVPRDVAVSTLPQLCPVCHSTEVGALPPPAPGRGHGERCCRRGGRRSNYETISKGGVTCFKGILPGVDRGRNGGRFQGKLTTLALHRPG